MLLLEPLPAIGEILPSQPTTAVKAMERLPQPQAKFLPSGSYLARPASVQGSSSQSGTFPCAFSPQTIPESDAY